MPPVSMSEERHSGDLLESRPSSARVALGVAGVVIGLAALVCGGVAGYVALTTTEPAVVERPSPPAEEPANIRAIADRIVALKIPARFEPTNGTERVSKKTRVFGPR